MKNKNGHIMHSVAAPFTARLNFVIEEYAASKGKLPPWQYRKRNVVFVATIEKVQYAVL